MTVFFLLLFFSIFFRCCFHLFYVSSPFWDTLPVAQSSANNIYVSCVFCVVFFDIFLCLQWDLDVVSFVSVLRVVLSCCFTCSRLFFSPFYPTFFCPLDHYICWLGVLPFSCTFYPLSVVSLAVLVRFSVCWHLTGFPMLQNNLVIWPLGQFCVLFLRPPVAQHFTTPMPTIRATPYTSNIVCLLLLCALFWFWP